MTASLWSADDPKVTLANSSIYLEATGHVVMAWIWLEQLLAAGVKTGSFYNGKRLAAQYFFRYELPKTTPSSTCSPHWTEPQLTPNPTRSDGWRTHP